jgi:outer membrane protein assembly factor BamD (BamD/ComL family)
MEEKADEFRKLSDKEKGEATENALEELEKAYVDFADRYPQAPETPEFIFRAAEVNGNELGKIGRSIQLYERIAKDYPQSASASTALFLAGYSYHNTLHDLIRAEKAFKSFLERYPNHELAPAAQHELSTLGKPVKEILDELTKDKGWDSVMKRDTNHP